MRAYLMTRKKIWDTSFYKPEVLKKIALQPCQEKEQHKRSKILYR